MYSREMANREIFSKHLPNVKLATRLDAEGREVLIERREDVDAAIKEQETFDMLVKEGYYRARIKGLSSFDKVVGGMTWCIECCDYDVDVDLLFHENLTIGQKISLVEKIVMVLPQMKCPFRIEPHQIQGLEFLSIHSVIQWLVKKSVENRAERAQRLKKFAIGQFHNNYQYITDKEQLAKRRNASTHIKRIQELYSPCREYQRKEVGNEDEQMRVRMTLLEYRHRNEKFQNTENESNFINDEISTQTDDQDQDSELEVDKLFEKHLISREEQPLRLDESERSALQRHYFEFKQEMEADSKELSEQHQIKTLLTTIAALDSKLQRNKQETELVEAELREQQVQLEQEQAEQIDLNSKLSHFKEIEANVDPQLLSKVQELMRQHDQLKKEETEYKEYCRKDLSDLQHVIDDLKAFNAKNPEEQAAEVSKEKTRIQELKLQLAKKNRAIVVIQRQLDAIPDRTELTQYQRRFHELYNEMSAKHLETKQYYALFNTLNDKKRYLEKELSLLNSICEAYNEGIVTAHGREEFIKQFEKILNGVRQAEEKVRRKHNEERVRRDMLNSELQELLELQRQYAVAVKQLTEECQRCDQLQQYLKSIVEKKSSFEFAK